MGPHVWTYERCAFLETSLFPCVLIPSLSCYYAGEGQLQSSSKPYSSGCIWFFPCMAKADHYEVRIASNKLSLVCHNREPLETQARSASTLHLKQANTINQDRQLAPSRGSDPAAAEILKKENGEIQALPQASQQEKHPF